MGSDTYTIEVRHQAVEFTDEQLERIADLIAARLAHRFGLVRPSTTTARGDRPGIAAYNVQQAAALLGVSDGSAYQEIKLTGRLAGIPVIRVGRRITISQELLDRRLRGETLPGDRDAEAAHPSGL